MAEQLPREPRNDLGYWRGQMDARLHSVEGTINEIRNTLTGLRGDVERTIDKSNTEITGRIGELEKKFETSERILYRIVGIGMAVGTILSFLLSRFVGKGAP